MVVEVYKLINGHSLELKEDITFDSEYFVLTRPLLKINSCKVLAKIHQYDDFINVHLKVNANVILECSYSLQAFESNVSGEEELNFSTYESEEDEDFIIYKGNKIELDEYIFDLVSASVPLSPKAPGATLPKSGKGYRVISEDSLVEEEANKGNSKFDKLLDLDLD